MTRRLQKKLSKARKPPEPKIRIERFEGDERDVGEPEAWLTSAEEPTELRADPKPKRSKRSKASK